MPQPMKYLNPVLAAALCLVALVVKVEAQAGQPQAPPDAPASQLTFTGTDVYKDYCAVCHGTTARGDGPLADRMKRRPPDLTVLATQNGGVFPAEQVRKIIDGRESVPGHGGPDMPVWGRAFKASRLGSSEESVEAVIDALVKHIESLQQKPAQ
jgi:mono/diheme cytochrome c family protein